MAPHTGIRDFFLGFLMIRLLNLKMALIMKKELFVFPIAKAMKRVGMVPVDREHARNFVKFSVNLIKESDEIAYIICPEGTRKRVDKWKRGFYEIAMMAGVPIGLSHIDFRSRTLGVGAMFYPTGNYEADLAEIEKYYYGMQGTHKGGFNLEDREPYAHPEWLKK
ncbi:MAG: 1-acyl-sn-glycerol-3-phosphate acyltransferase [Bacteroidales bacterium]|nr:1-acyl-sn-glycerol-3-phosphate acyltransferase [Bacteroidales bacterium]